MDLTPAENIARVPIASAIVAAMADRQYVTGGSAADAVLAAIREQGLTLVERSAIVAANLILDPIETSDEHAWGDHLVVVESGDLGDRRCAVCAERLLFNEGA